MNAVSDQHAEVISIAEQRAARDARRTEVGDAARPRCDAATTQDRRCRNYAVVGDRCRVHAPPSDPGESGPGDDPVGPAPGAEGVVAPSDDGRPVRSDDERHAPAGGGDRPGAASGDRSGASSGDRSGAASEDREFAWAEQELADRGFGRAIDGLALLRRFADDHLVDRLRTATEVARRRLAGDYTIDEFGFDEDLTTSIMMPLLRPLHRSYWRVASHGAEHVPASGAGLVVANHAGTLPVDALITRLDLFDATGRHARELGADLVFRTPVVGPLARKTGATLASGDDADRLLEAGELVAVWPEGYKGLGKPWRDRYKLQRFGRGGFVATALRAQAPIVPTAIVGSEEIYPLLFDLRAVARLFGLPYFPVVAQALALPVLGPFALLPLPSRWIIEYGEPIDTTDLGPAAAEDPMVVFDLTDRVRDTIQQMLYRNLMGRRSVFL